MKDQETLIRLKSELQFLNDGGYTSIFWRPYAVFEESLLCINPLRLNRPVVCQKCPLIEFVAEDKRHENIPCRHIVLNDFGLTPRELPEWGTKQQMENAMREWLQARIKDLEARIMRSDSTIASEINIASTKAR
jgi:hypothetical protein